MSTACHPTESRGIAFCCRLGVFERKGRRGEGEGEGRWRERLRAQILVAF